MSTPKSCPKRSSMSRYFADLDDSDLSEDSDNQSDDPPAVPTSVNLLSKNKQKPSAPSSNPQNKSNKLPSAHECLSSDKKPEYLRLNSEKQINWDKIELRLPSDENGDQPPTEYKNSSVPPPTSYEPQTDPGIKVVDSEGRKRKTIGDDLEDQMTSTKAYKVTTVDPDKD